MKILKITDSKVGHITVSDGVIDAVEQHSNVDEVIILTIGLRAKFLLRILRFVLKYHLLSSRLVSSDLFMRMCYKNFKKPDTEIDLIVSTGGDTQFANVWLSYVLDVDNIFCGTLKGVPPKYFSLIMSTTDLKTDNSIKLDILPTKSFPQDIDQRVERFCDEKKVDKKEKYFVLLIGGDGSGYHYTKSDYETLVHAFMSVVKRYHAKALITTSRRTGAEEELLIKELLSKYSDDIAYSVYFIQKPEKVVGVYLELASMLFVTEESSSMISESLLCRKPIFTLYPEKIKEVKSYQSFLKGLIDKERIHTLSIKNDLADIVLDQFHFHYIEKLPTEELSEKIQPFLKKNLNH